MTVPTRIPAYRPDPTVDEWINAKPRNTVTFKSTNILHKSEGIVCQLVSWPDGNYVSADGTALNAGDAFLAALAQIEKTIGDWRK